MNLLRAFEQVLERLGGKFVAFENDQKRRRKITFHSFRRYVKSTISDLGYSDFSEYILGHLGSTYYRRSVEDRITLFRKVEPSLTFLDQSSLERKGADLQSKVEILEKRMSEMNELLAQVYKKEKKLGIVK